MDQFEIKKLLRDLYPILEDATLNGLSEHAILVKHPKGTKLFSEGMRNHYYFVVVKGCAKSYYSKDEKEVCLWFAFESETLGTLKTLIGEPSNETIELLEHSELIRFEIDRIKKLAGTDIAISHFINELVTEHALFLEERLSQLQFMSSKQRYESLLSAVPEVSQRVSLTDIASYIGVSRETLSRIRSQK